jgi:integrase/recombinase XerD
VNVDLWKQRFAEHLRVRQCSPRTVGTYSAELSPFFAFLDGVGCQDLASVTRDLVEEYRTYLFYIEHRGKRLGVRTQSVRLAAVKAFMSFLTRERYLLIDPGSGVELPHVPRTVPPVLLSEEEAEQLMRGPDTRTVLGVRDRAILEVFYGTGLRNSEVLSLDLDHVDLDKKEIRLQRGKGGHGRVVPLGEEAIAWLSAYLQRSRPLLVRAAGSRAFFLTSRGNRFTKGNLAELVRRCAAQAKLSKVVTPHLLRHACACHMLRAGAGIRHLQKLLGHACLSTTQRYTTLDVTDLRAVVAACHPRERGHVG